MSVDFGFYHIDCMDGMKNIPDDFVDLTLTDIPYDEVNGTRNGGDLRKLHKDAADVITFDLESFLSELFRITRGTIIIFCGKSQFSQIFRFYADTNATVRQIIWEKTNPSPMNGEKIYLSGVENAVWARKPKATYNGFCKNTVFRFPCGSSEIHPTEKNHQLLAELIGDNSNIGDIVFDPCAGSASTLVVARNMGRKFLGFEKDKEYFEKALKRLEYVVAQTTIFDFMED